MKQFSFLVTALFWGLITYGQITVSTFAGSGAQDNLDGVGVQASFFIPTGIVFDASGNLFVADLYNHVIRKITPNAEVTTFAGSGTPGSIDRLGTTASFYYPNSLAIDTNGNLYVSDMTNNKIRKITPSGLVTTFAGSGTYGGEDGTGISASFKTPKGLVFDTSGNLYVADSGNNKIRKINTVGEVTTFADLNAIDILEGIVKFGGFTYLSHLVIDKSGNLFASCEYNNKIRKITPGAVISTFAGSGTNGSTDGTGINATFFLPTGLAIDTNENIYVCDQFSNKIRKITPSAVVNTYAGSGRSGSLDGLANIARFEGPSGLTFDSSGVLYVAENSNKIRKILEIPTTLSNTNFDISSKLNIYSSSIPDYVTVEIKDLLNPKLQVIDMTGKVVLNQNLDKDTNNISLSGLPAGLYIFKVSTSQGSATSKAIKN